MRDLTTLETFKETKLVTEISKMATKVKENSAEIAIMCSMLYELNPNKETTELLIEKTGFSKSTISQLKEAGAFYRKHPDMIKLETYKAYLISSIEKKDEDVVVEDLSNSTVKELKNKIKNKKDKQEVDKIKNKKDKQEVEKEKDKDSDTEVEVEVVENEFVCDIKTAVGIMDIICKIADNYIFEGERNGELAQWSVTEIYNTLANKGVI